MDSQSPVFTILATESEHDFAVQVATVLGYASAHIVVGSPASAVGALSTRAIPPQYIVIDIGSRGADVLPELDTLAEYCSPNSRVVVLGTINDVGFYRELRQRGVLEYFTRPVKISNIRSALLHDGDSATPGGGAAVVTFMSAASGDGSSSVALNTAYSLAYDYGKSVVVIDMDFQFGMIARNLDLTSPFGIKEIFEHPERTIDATLVNRMLVEYGGRDRMKVIAAPNDLRLWPDIRPETIRDLLSTLRGRFDFIVIDLPHIWSTWVAAALSESTQSVLVAQLWLRSVTHTARLLGAWRDIGIDDDAIRIIINRSGAKFKEAVSAKDYETVCQKTIDFHLINDIKTVVAAENQGKTIPEIGNSPLARQFRELAARIITKHTGEKIIVPGIAEPVARTQEPKAGLSGLFKRS